MKDIQRPRPPAITTMLRRYSLARIEIMVSLHGVGVHAIPDTFNPLVAKRREAGAAEAAEADGSVSLAKLAHVTESAMKSVAYAHGKSQDEALAALAVELQRVFPE